MKFDPLVRNIVVGSNSCRAGIVIMKFPGSDGAIAAKTAADFDNACRTEIGPGEFFFAGPDQLDRPFAARASRAASMAASPVCLPPYPDPVSGISTRTLSSGILKASASSPRTPNGRCVPVQTVSLSPDHCATAARGSSGA